MTNKIDVEGVVEDMRQTFLDVSVQGRDVHFSEVEVASVLFSRKLERTLTTLLNQAEEEKMRAVEEERERIRKDLRRVYFDIITSCCDECALGSKFNCGGCGGTRRPSNASCGEPLDKYLKLWKK